MRIKQSSQCGGGKWCLLRGLVLGFFPVFRIVYKLEQGLCCWYVSAASF